MIRKMTLKRLLRQRALKIPSLIAAARRFNSSLVETEQDGEIFLISIARPEKRNAVDAETAKELADAFRHFEIDDESSVAVLYGKGDTFCAGYDLEYLSTRGPDQFLRWLTPPLEKETVPWCVTMFTFMTDTENTKYKNDLKLCKHLASFLLSIEFYYARFFLNGRLLFCYVFFLVCFVLHSLIVCPLVQ